jgi:hypothetical protein
VLAEKYGTNWPSTPRQDEATGKMRLTDRGRSVAKDKAPRMAVFLRESIAALPPYMAL